MEALLFFIQFQESFGLFRNILLGWHFYLPDKRAESRVNMTQLELVAEIGSEAVRIAWMYLEGLLTLDELENILGERKAGLIHEFVNEQRKECVV